MTDEEIATIRNLRACHVPWTVISRHQGYSVSLCRAAIGLPTYDKPAERRVMPWDVVQKTLFNTENEGKL